MADGSSSHFPTAVINGCLEFGQSSVMAVIMITGTIKFQADV
jgi:hypothetical protein